jgi:hypothetical protein
MCWDYSLYSWYSPGHKPCPRNLNLLDKNLTANIYDSTHPALGIGRPNPAMNDASQVVTLLEFNHEFRYL